MEAMRRALEIAESIGDTDCRMRCLRTIGLYQHLTGRHAEGLAAFETFAALVEATDSPAAPEAGFHLSISEYFIGRLGSARQRLERLRDQVRDGRRQTIVYQSDIYIDIACALTIVEWLTGHPDTAVETSKSNVATALASKHHMSISNALNAALPVFYWTGEHEACERAVAVLDEEGHRHGILTRRPVAMFYRAALTSIRDGPKPGVEALTHAIAQFRAINHLARMPYYLSVLADTQARSGAHGEAMKTISAALDLAHANSEGWCLPEVQRVCANLVITAGRVNEGEALLLQSLSSATATGALSWRLRAATDLARLWSSTSRKADASSLLSAVHREFTQGFGTPDLMAARELLATLAADPDQGCSATAAPILPPL
jgi:hypothetical protein